MKTAALISGGKDSCFNMMCCVAEGHDIVALANLRPCGKDELDSYMYQTVGHHAIGLYAEAMDLPLYTHVIKGSSVCTTRDYLPQDHDEVEDLFELLSQIKTEKEIEAVSVGAILSDYQRVRVENVCQRLNLKVLSFLWRRDQEELLKEMIACDIKAIIIKVAALGLLPSIHLGMELSEILPHMLKMKEKYGLNVCGEGGEYETFVLDCPLFKKSLVIDEKECVTHSDDAFAPVAYLNLKKCHLQTKPWDDSLTLKEKVLQLPITTSFKLLHQQLPTEFLNQFDENIRSRESIDTVGFECSRDEELEQISPLVHSDGVYFQVAGIRAVVSDSLDVAMATQQAMNCLMSCVEKLGHQCSEIVSVSLCVQNMSDYAAINPVYNTFFSINPPVRLCIQAALPPNIAFQIDCQGRKNTKGDRLTMHVQALSHWAPANIGPYSQAVMVGGKLFVAGIVPLVPASLTAIDGGIVSQSRMSLSYIQKVLKAMCSSCTLAHCPLVMCFVTNHDYIAVAKEMWTHSLKEVRNKEGQVTIDSLTQFCVVPKLPRSVLVEWQVYAWPFCSENEDLKMERLCQTHPLYSVTLECHSLQNLFSCRIKAVATHQSFDVTELSVEKLSSDILAQYFSLQNGYDLSSAPLVRICFPSSKFTSSQLHKAFTTEMFKYANVKLPVLSFIPVIGLETDQHLIAWCQ